MAETKGTAQTRAKNKYNAKTYDNLRIVVPKGQKEVIKAHAEKQNETINGFVKRAINETMERDTAKQNYNSSSKVEKHDLQKFNDR